MLEIKDLSIAFKTRQGTKPVVKAVSFKIEKGKTLALVGESGSGKTLIALSIMQLLPVTAYVSARSKIIFDKKDLLLLPEFTMRHVRGRRIGMIFQEAMTALNPVLTIGQQIEEVLCAHFKMAKRARNLRVIDLLNQVGIKNPRQCAINYPHQLSGGMRQRALIAIALAGEPELLIADEPTTSIDVTLQAQILSLLRTLQNKMGMSILFITHDLGVVSEMADRVVVMQQGEVVEQAPATRFFKNPQHPYTLKLFSAIPRFDRIEKEAVKQADKTLLSVRDLKVYFPIKKGFFKRPVDYVRAVDGVSFEVQVGKTLALVGESGSGKSTIANAVMCLQRPTEGEVLFCDHRVSHLGYRSVNKLRQDFQMIFQDPYASLNPRMLVRNIIEEGLLVHRKKLVLSERLKRIDELLALVGLEPEHKDRYPHEFSGGQRQRICIARALAVEPKLLVCDEPTSALDVTVQMQILKLLRALQSDLGLSYLLITHNMGVVGYLADEVAVMHRGRFVERGLVRDILFSPQDDYTKQLMAAVPKITQTIEELE